MKPLAAEGADPAELGRFSAALCRGLIEAHPVSARSDAMVKGFPRLYVAASLSADDLRHVQPVHRGFPRLYVAASLKRLGQDLSGVLRPRFSAALCRGLIEAGCRTSSPPTSRSGFPRLYVAASLKHRSAPAMSGRSPGGFSAALCRGLIEASWSGAGRWRTTSVFRGFMSRPH